MICAIVIMDTNGTASRSEELCSMVAAGTLRGAAATGRDWAMPTSARELATPIIAVRRTVHHWQTERHAKICSDSERSFNLSVLERGGSSHPVRPPTLPHSSL